MAIEVLVIDSESGECLSVLDNAALFMERPIPPLSTPGGQKMRVFRQHLTDDGLAADGSNQDMAVDGSVTAQDFYVEAHATRDRYISIISFVIAEPNANNNEFANLGAALSNGCHLFYEDDEGEVDIHDALTTNFEFVRLCGGEPAFGSTTNTFRASNISGNAEGYIPVLDLKRFFGFRWGVLLRRGTRQKLVMRVQDDLSATDQFDCIAYGFERLP